jgi:undecaprenyl-diphosphatase
LASRRPDLATGLRWLRGHLEADLLLVIAVVAGAAWVVLGLADEIREGDTVSFDTAVLLALRTPGNPSDPVGPPFVDEMMRDITALGGFSVLGPLSLAAAGLLWLQGRRQAVWLLLVAVAGGQVFSNLAKTLFDRPRPDLVPHGALVSTASFPSGHSLMAAITYLTLAVMIARTQDSQAVRIYLVALAVLITFAVGVSRVYLGVHWPTDVIAGWAAGAGWALLCLFVAERIGRRRGA